MPRSSASMSSSRRRKKRSSPSDRAQACHEERGPHGSPLALSVTLQEDSLGGLQIGLRVDSEGVEVDGFHVKRKAVFEQAELLKAFGLFQRGRAKFGETLQGLPPVCIEPDVLPVRHVADAVAVVGNGGTRKIERAAVEGGDHLYGIGIVDILWRAQRLDG